MGDLTAHFSRREFVCRGNDCCNQSAPISLQLVDALEMLREAVERPLIVASGFRCRKHNATVGGASNSQHTFGLAADIIVPRDMDIEVMIALAKLIPAFATGGIGRYGGFVHLDIRTGGPARWSGGLD